MRVPWPRTLFARLMLIWLVGIALVLAISISLFMNERHRYARDVLVEGMARELVAAIDVLDRLSAEQRVEWIETLGRRRLRFMLAPPPPAARALRGGDALHSALQRALPGRAIAVLEIPRTHDRFSPHPRVLASVTLVDGRPLTVRLPGPLFAPPPRTPPESLVTSLLALIVGVTLLSWLAVRIATRPISQLAAAADAFGADPERASLTLRGPVEVVRASQAFSQMQQRIREHVGERTRILAAISHDLQTPITRLRLRAELVDDDALRAKIQSDLDAMQALAKEGLAYARSLDPSAPEQAIDLDALVGALVEDARDMGWDVRMSGHVAQPCYGRVEALRRALWNLIENGVKFGQSVDVALVETAAAVEIRVRDRGRGLADAELEKVFEPFYRTESSRSRDTGGTGLGLAIARNLLRAQRGDVRLENRPGGGLDAVVTLPRPPRASG